MKIIGLLFGLYLGSIMSAQAQDLSKDATSIITDSRTEVLCKSMTQSIEKESRTILILNRKGLNAAHFLRLSTKDIMICSFHSGSAGLPGILCKRMQIAFTIIGFFDTDVNNYKSFPSYKFCPETMISS